MNHTLKPCPFCGSKAEFKRLARDSLVRCTNANDCPTRTVHDDAETAAEYWNRRAPSDTQVNDAMVSAACRAAWTASESMGPEEEIGPERMRIALEAALSCLAAEQETKP